MRGGTRMSARSQVRRLLHSLQPGDGHAHDSALRVVTISTDGGVLARPCASPFPLVEPLAPLATSRKGPMRPGWSLGRVSVLVAVAVILVGLILPFVSRGQRMANRTQDIWDRKE